MKITDLLDQKSISLGASPKTKEEAIDQAVALMEKSGNVKDLQGYRQSVLARELLSTTGIGDGIAIPHGKSKSVKRAGLAAMVIPKGVDFDALDGEPVHLLFLIAAPESKSDVHLEVLQKLSTLLMQDGFMEQLQSAKTEQEFLSIIDEAEVEPEAIQEPPKKNEDVICDILAVTACPTGIAHTYMAAEALQKAATAKNCTIKVETRGSSGAKNVLTVEEIQNADCIIVAADTKVPMERFGGKKVIECQVSDGISKAENLVEQAILGNAPILENTHTNKEEHTKNNGHKVYMQLMNGVSHMLPFVVGGGILIALSFLIDGLSVDLNALTEIERSALGSITPVAATLKEIGGIAFGFMLPVLAGFIAMSIGDRPALALGFVGGLMAANGQSGFLGALLIGFVSGYVILGLQKITNHLPQTIEKIAPVILFPVFGILTVGLVMMYLVETPIGALNTALNQGLLTMSGTSKMVLGLILGGMMAIDMGGPFNKAAYVFGTASIASGNYDIMAAVMVGGMVPPCAIALATILFQNKFTKEERASGPVNFIMGLAFITEGAIPFASADPLRVLPSCIIGSAVAGALSMMFGCTLMAPHGGIFVFPVVGNPFQYVIALLVGVVIGALILGVCKKKTI
ncbi:fructose-specific PTS transporter subunit EIIC [Chakrabartyella piscis]|uniref:PTS fructose transporter subunit IIABC n=1 Tax=Chakrabartyella piscis TaxID=2918914 RepID=UPI0029584778|nr:fructose-specific PTS transporter subunit EIIC [Chakrabartyella piscis]